MPGQTNVLLTDSICKRSFIYSFVPNWTTNMVAIGMGWKHLCKVLLNFFFVPAYNNCPPLRIKHVSGQICHSSFGKSDFFIREDI